MLVLSRKKTQSIVIGDNIKLEIIKVSGNTVRIGITAPSEVKVLRGELAPWGISDVDTSDETHCDPESSYSVELKLPLESEQSESFNEIAFPSA